MAKTKWRCREFKPTANMPERTHSFYAEAVINNEIDNRDLSAKIAARTGRYSLHLTFPQGAALGYEPKALSGHHKFFYILNLNCRDRSFFHGLLICCMPVPCSSRSK